MIYFGLFGAPGFRHYVTVATEVLASKGPHSCIVSHLGLTRSSHVWTVEAMCVPWEFPKSQGAESRPQLVRLLFQGHPQKGPPICRTIHIGLEVNTNTILRYISDIQTWCYSRWHMCWTLWVQDPRQVGHAAPLAEGSRKQAPSHLHAQVRISFVEAAVLLKYALYCYY